MQSVQKTTVYLERSVYQRVKVLARQQGRTPAALIREAVAAYAPPHGARRPRSVGSGRSGRHDLSERAEQLLAGLGR